MPVLRYASELAGRNDRAELTIGRSADNDLVVRDGKVSRRHAILQRGGNGWQVIDLDSRHGTFVNGVRVQESGVLRLGDEIEPSSGVRLARAAIRSTADFLRDCHDHPSGRRTVSTTTGISETLLLRWAHLADLMRVSGIGPQYAELLEAAGVATVAELRDRQAEHLHKSLIEANDRVRLARNVPPRSRVASWISAAARLEPLVSH